ncbi:hypothetical protein IWZ03DRAFT_154629 [Phyllosticta citriasiana]|uniref:Fungal N-terminal domain-containing protein n=1 Tax=Phyllosticta citriasiana TaxID=595635 RepID=A0ABR1KRC2_9PEZI
MDPLSVLASTAQIASLCGSLINTLGRFVDDSKHVDTTIESMLIEIRMLRDVSQLVHSTMRAQSLDELDEYWRNVKTLLGRCDKTLKKLNSVLANISARHGLGRMPIMQLHLNMKSHTVAILRRHIKSHTHALQVLLQLVHLMTAAQNHGTIRFELEELKARIQDVKNSLSSREPTSQFDSQDVDLSQKDIQEEERVVADFEKFMESAEAASEIASMNASACASVKPASSIRSDSRSTQERKTSTRTWRDDLWELDGMPLEEKLRNFQQELSLTPDSPDSDSDPDPDYEDHFPANVNARLVERFRIAARDELQAGNFNRAENSLMKMIEHLEEGERKHGKPFDRIKVREQLAEVHYKQGKLDDAKDIYKGLIAARSDERGKSDRDKQRRLPGCSDEDEKTQEIIQRQLDECRWYYWLSRIYLLQHDLKHAVRGSILVRIHPTARADISTARRAHHGRQLPRYVPWRQPRSWTGAKAKRSHCVQPTE